mmetsp:Transcript_133021/g.323321  ORF Transcript_133021/g.323321 Transcript_133021/m.323321 type:complete len:144 (+) Transcript_133021:65-496(+)
MAATPCISSICAPAPVRLATRRSGLRGGSRVTPQKKPRGRATLAVASESKTFDDDWLKADTTVHLLTLFGWSIPSGIAIKAYGDTSLLAAFADSIGSNLANFPQGPGLDDKFWLYLITWHIGLFSTMLLGQIGWQGRKQGYFK